MSSDRAAGAQGALALIRHTAVLAAPGLCYGRLDLPPADEAPALVARIAALRPCIIVTSPSARCRVLAERAAVRAAADLRTDVRLRELDFGAWEGRAWADIPRAELSSWAADPLRLAPPGGERGADLIARVHACYDDLPCLAGTVAIVSHGGPLRVLAALARGDSIDLLAPAPALGSCVVVTRTPAP